MSDELLYIADDLQEDLAADMARLLIESIESYLGKYARFEELYGL